MEAMETVVDDTIDRAEDAVRRALSHEGFGVLTEIDVSATLRAKLGVERSPLKILGACKPSLAHEALSLDPSLALVLPCNVVLAETERGRTSVSIGDPRVMLAMGDRAASKELHDLAEEAAAALRRALRQLDG